MSVKLTVNGQSATVDVPPNMPLLWVVRDSLNLRGTKYAAASLYAGLVRFTLTG